MILLCIMLTEVHMVLPDSFDNERKWLIYLGLSEITKALLCMVALTWAPPRMHTAMFLASVWYLTQAAQEFMGENTGSTERWEYWLVALIAGTITIQLTRK